MCHIHTSIISRHLATRGNKKYCAHLHHTLLALKRDFPTSLVAPLPNSEQTNLPSSNHTYTKSLPNHIHHHYAPSATHDTHHLFNCTHIRTTLSPLDLWTDPTGVMELLDRYAGWWTKGGMIGLPPPPPQPRVKGVSRHNKI